MASKLMPSEWAIREAAKFFAVDMPTDAEYLHALAATLDAARAQGRRERLDQVAAVVEKHRAFYAGSKHRADRVAFGVCGLIADDIRAIIDKEPRA